MKSTTARKTTSALLGMAITLLPLATGSITPVEARDEVAYAQYNGCKKGYRHSFVNHHLNGDWSRYKQSYEWMWHETCKHIMEGKW